jgi:hypothetical protein
MIATGRRRLALSIALACTALPRVAAAAEDLGTCTATISTVPVVISAPGTYCVNDYLFLPNWSGTAIRIDADDVVLDCNGFELDGHQAEETTQAVGIQATNRHDITVRRCVVRHFHTGLLVTQAYPGTSERHLIEDNVFYGNRYAGMLVTGNDTVIRRNRVLETGVGVPQLHDAFGIRTEGAVDILDNTVSGIETDSNYGGPSGISVLYNPGGSVRGNRVRGLRDRNTGIPLGIGVYSVNADSRVTVRNNILSGTGSGWGLNCRSQSDFFQPDVHARNNTVVGYAIANEGCVDDGNVVRP